MTELKQKTLVNFKKTKSLLAKIIKMIEADEYCVDVMQQNLAATGLLKSAHQMLMENHLNTCFQKAISSNDDKRKQAMINEILTVTRLYNK